MGSIEVCKQDFNSQIKDLTNISNDKIFDECIFVGSGDSYAAGLAVEFLSNHRCVCYSPSDLINSKFTNNKTYCFISVTGKTRANILAAQQAVKAGVRTIAITLNEKSKLAQVCRETIPLKITKSEMPTSGFKAFTANVVTCLQIAGLAVSKNFDKWQKNGIRLSSEFSESITLPKTESIYLLGNNLLYAISVYASFQLAEFFGTAAIPQKLEEFCHSPIFGIKKSDHQWILGQDEGSVSKSLAKLNHNISYIELNESDKLTQLFQSIFFVQNLMLLLAEKYNYDEIQYLNKKDILNTSSDLIYHV